MWKKCILIRASQGTSAERCGGVGVWEGDGYDQ